MEEERICGTMMKFINTAANLTRFNTVTDKHSYGCISLYRTKFPAESGISPISEP